MIKKATRQPNDGNVKQKDFDSLLDFLGKNMVTKTEFNQLASVAHGLDKKVDHQFSQLMTVLDGIANRLDAKDKEDAAQVYVNKRHETWIKEVAHQTKSTLSKSA